ncbi:MAG: TRAP transporter small permease subunit [Deltaproteobacteria bacterium]|nr:TRAP transporter small permease subunit [Deltaproteobacteria bacterium]
MHALRRTLERVDALIYRVERTLLLACVFGMTLLVFLQVLQRTFTRQVGKTTQLLFTTLDGLFGPLAETTRQSIFTIWGDVLFIGFSIFFCIAAVHAARSSRAERDGLNDASVDFAGSLGMGALLFLGTAAALKAMLWLLPTGVPGAQKYALGMLVWSGLLGASIVTRTRGHILLDAVKKKLDDDTMPWISAIGALLTSSIAGLISFLAMHSTIEKLMEWYNSDFLLERLYDNGPVPIAAVVFALPVCFGLIALRFFAQGISDLLWGPPIPEPEEELVLDGEEPETPVEPPAYDGPLFGEVHIEGGAA